MDSILLVKLLLHYLLRREEDELENERIARKLITLCKATHALCKKDAYLSYLVRRISARGPPTGRFVVHPEWIATGRSGLICKLVGRTFVLLESTINFLVSARQMPVIPGTPVRIWICGHYDAVASYRLCLDVSRKTDSVVAITFVAPPRIRLLKHAGCVTDIDARIDLATSWELYTVAGSSDSPSINFTLRLRYVETMKEFSDQIKMPLTTTQKYRRENAPDSDEEDGAHRIAIKKLKTECTRYFE